MQLNVRKPSQYYNKSRVTLLLENRAKDDLLTERATHSFSGRNTDRLIDRECQQAVGKTGEIQ